MYKPRHAEKAIARLAKNFGAVLVTGARQVGKTTLLKEFGKGFTPGLRYVTLDNPLTLNEAVSEGSVFFKQHKPPLVIHPLEIKKHANPGPADIAAFGVIEKINGYSRGEGGVICA
ncbi:MAG: AAA family ATPase, partial [Treponema sp.]|nr:AAA family ATPase [Treponema sp.]